MMDGSGGLNVVRSEGDHFLEKDECMDLLEVLCEFCIDCHKNGSVSVVKPRSEQPIGVHLQENADLVSKEEQAVIKLVHTLEKYQEQSHLLDRHLEDLVMKIMNTVKKIIQLRNVDREASDESSFPFQVYRNEGLQLILKVLYILCKVRGYKSIVKHLPHEVADLEPTLWLLQCQDPKDHSTWETRYSLLLWLSMLVLIPFDLETVDSTLASQSGSSSSGNAGQNSLVATVTDMCKNYLGESGPTREAAAICLARLLTRPDMESSYLQQYLEWSAVTLEEIGNRKEKNESNSTDQFLITGVFHSLVEIFKHGHREKLLSHCPSIFSRVLRVSSRDGQVTSLERKLTMKLVQRTGLNFLPPKVVKWRYQRGQRSLLQNLSDSQATKSDENDNNRTNKQNEDQDDEEDDMEIPDEVEEVIEQLLCGLRDRDTIVRWSAAKGLGRITSRLPEALADDVVAFVLELFDASEGDAAWHGGCLALAELARRGLLLPKRLSEVVPFVVRALIYDVRRGHNSVGANVRDAACYVCWAFARAYEPSVMAPHVKDLCPQMLVTGLFDREVNCRRAASAAFQENVGRQGHDNFPFGIEILTAADYFTLGVRSNAYLEISPFVAQYEPYRRPLIDHLVKIKLFHWDLPLRILSAEALHVLTKRDPEYMAGPVLRELLPKTLSPDMLVRHGATLAVGHIVRALAAIPYQLSTWMLGEIRNTVMRIEKARLYRGRGGEWMRVAACRLIEAMALAGHPLSYRAQKRLLESIEESLKHPKDEVKEAAVAALKALSMEYFGPDAKQEDGSDALFINPATDGGGEPSPEDPNPGIINNASSKVHKHSPDRVNLVTRPKIPQMIPPVRTEIVDRLVGTYCASLETADPNPAVRRGCTLALGALPAHIIAATSETLNRVLKSLIDSTKLEEDAELRDAETRRNAVIALSQVVESCGIACPGHEQDQKTVPLNANQIKSIFDALMEACNDYETDNRGDVGSWVRIVAVESLLKVVHVIRTYPETLLRAKRETTVKTKTFGEVSVLRWIPSSDQKVAWAHVKSDPAGGVRKIVLDSEELASAGKGDGFLIPGAEERTKHFTPDCTTKARSSVINQTPMSELKDFQQSAYGLYMNSSTCEAIINCILKQLCEKMGVVREGAGNALIRLLESADNEEHGMPFPVPHLQLLRKVFHEDHEKDRNWKVESYTYPRVASVLGLSEYVDHALGGLVLSVGDLTESVSKNASQALLDWCKIQKEQKEFTDLAGLSKACLQILEDNAKCDRVIVPALKTLDLLFEAQIFTFDKHPRLQWLLKVHDCIKNEIKGSANVSKLVICGKVLFHLSSFMETARTISLGSILILLGHKYPRVRTSVAKDFNMWALALDGAMICGDEPGKKSEDETIPSSTPTGDEKEDFIQFMREQHAIFERQLADRSDAQRPPMSPDYDPEQAFDDAQDVIAEVDWNNLSTREARAQRDRLYDLLRIPKPQGVTAAAAKPERKPEDNQKEEEDTYATLIHSAEMGYK